MSKLDKLDYYTLLGIPDEASLVEIKRAFRKFARKYHPDRHAGDGAKVEQAAEIYRRGSEAFQVLSDARARRAYDAVLKQGQVRLSAEEVHQATKDEKVAPKKKHQPIKSPQALAYYKQGIAAANKGDWRGCWRYLKLALNEEPNNPFIKQRIREVDRRLRGF